VSAELCEQVKQNRKHQPCRDRQASHNGARYKWLVAFCGRHFGVADDSGVDRHKRVFDTYLRSERPGIATMPSLVVAWPG